MVVLELLGLPLEDLEQLVQWTDDLVRGIGYTGREQLERASEALAALRAHLENAVAGGGYRSGPGLLGALVAAEQRGELTASEVYANCVFLLGAAQVSTANSIANGVLALLSNPDQLDLLRRRPSLIASAVEELLRYDGSNQATARFPVEHVEIDGRSLAPGEQVTLLLGAANRDPERFPNPDRLDITRVSNRHLAFAQGIHYCLGASLARLEMQVAVNALVDRFPTMRLTTGEPEWEPHMLLRALKRLPVAV
jgi:cytochrome P450